jgi:hypothetical protein
MADLSQLGFDPEAVDPTPSYEPIPAGWYVGMIVDSEMRETRTGGAQLVLRIDITDGDYTGRAVFERLNLINSNPAAVEIAQRTLASICRAVGVMARDSEELHDRPLRVKVAIRPAEGQYEASNVPKAYEPIKSAAPGATPAPAATPKPNARPAATAPKKPWEK